MIPPPYVGESKTVSKVFVTKINSDLSCDFISPHSIQDPTYVNYDEDMLQVRLDDPYFDGEGFLYVKFCWQRYCLLSALNNTIRGYGQKDNGLLFSRLKFNLKAVCDSIIEGEMFRENFIHSIMIHCLRNAMKSINEELNMDSKPFRSLYSLSIMNLLNLLNVFRRSSCTDAELTDSTLLTERVGLCWGRY